MGNAGAVGHAEHVPLTRPGNHPAHGASRTPPLTGGCETNVAAYNAADAITSRPPMVRGLCPRDCIRGAVDVGGRTVGNAGATRQALTGASNPPRQSRDHGAPRTVHPTGGSETGLAAYNATGVINRTSRLR